jgi:hypothetical protein
MGYASRSSCTPAATLLLFAPSAPVAQLDRVPGFEPGGREFESLRARHIKKGFIIFGRPFVLST